MNKPRPIPYPEKEFIDNTNQQNRWKHTRRDTDTIGGFTVGFYENDEAIKVYFTNVITPIVEENGNSIKVPIMYANPERWKAVRKDGFMRDEKGKILTPVVAYRRTGFEKNRLLSRKVDANSPHVFQSFKANYNSRNRYTPFSKINNLAPEYMMFNIVVPDYVKLTYEGIIWTDLMVQMNKIQEAISYSESSYWGDERYRFFVHINNFSNAIEVEEGDDRSIKSTFEMTMLGYLIPDAIQREINEVSQKGFSTCQVLFDINVTDNLSGAAGMIDVSRTLYSDLIVGNTFNFSNEVTNYLHIHETRTADTLSTNTAIFTGEQFASSPYPLPETSIRDFDFYMNGQYLNPEDLVFEENGGSLYLSFVQGQVEYVINPETDEIVAVGKFKI